MMAPVPALLLLLVAIAQPALAASCQVHSPTLQASYEGDCVYGVAFGSGVATGQDGSRYEGQFLGGYRSGQGTMRYASGDTYTGQWRLDRREGYGRYVYGEGSPWRGDKYEGYWQKDAMHGKGTYIFYPANDRFEAIWDQGSTNTIGTTTLGRRKWAYDSVAQRLSEKGAQVCSVTTDGASPRHIATGTVQDAVADRVLVDIHSPEVLARSTLQRNPRWDVMTEWTLCELSASETADTP